MPALSEPSAKGGVGVRLVRPGSLIRCVHDECQRARSACVEGRMTNRLCTVVLVALLVVGGCSSSKHSTTATTPPAGGYQVAITASASSNAQLSVSGTTNVPDGTEILVSASRPFLDPELSTSNPRAASLGRSTTTVRQASYTAKITIDNGDLLAGVSTDYPIETISSTATVCAQVRTGVDAVDHKAYQPNADVRAEIGDNGEGFASSPNVTIFGSRTPTPSNWLEIMTTVDVPPPVDEISTAQHRAPRVLPIKGFCV